jgi:hypothetical protein
MAKRLGWENPIKPSTAALVAVDAMYPAPTNDREADHRHRLAQTEEMLLRYHAELAEGHDARP